MSGEFIVVPCGEVGGCASVPAVQSRGQPFYFKNKFKDILLQGRRARADVQPGHEKHV